MKVYDEKDNVVIVQSVASASTMISSVAGIAREYIVSKFPKNYFKKVYIDTVQTVSDQRVNDAYSKTANKIPYPSMSITPEISLDDPIGGMEKSMHLSSPNLYVRKDLNRTYKKLMIDVNNSLAIYYTSDYITTNFNFKIAVDSYIQNTDLSFFLKSKFQAGFFQYLNDQFLQTEIPKSFIHVIAHLNQLNMNDHDDMDKLRLLLIGTSHSNRSIRKRVNFGTGKDCFFIDERGNLLTLFSDLDCPPSIIREGQKEGEYVISFRLQVSCHIPNAFIMNISKDTLRKKLNKEIIEELESSNQQENGFYTIPSHIENVLTRKDTIEFLDASGKKQIGEFVYMDEYMHALNKKIENFSLLTKLKDDFTIIYRYCLDKKIDPTSLIHVRILSRGGILKEGEDFKIDYEPKEYVVNGKTFITKGLDLTFLKEISTDVKIVVYINRLLYESIESAIKNDQFYFNDNFLLTKFKLGSQKILTYAFKGKNELYTSNIDKSLRIMTPYGIGYIGLNDTKENEEKDVLKIYLGNNKIKEIKIE